MSLNNLAACVDSLVQLCGWEIPSDTFPTLQQLMNLTTSMCVDMLNVLCIHKVCVLKLSCVHSSCSPRHSMHDRVPPVSGTTTVL